MEDESENEEEEPQQKGFARGAPAQGISQDERMGRTAKGSVVEVLKQVRRGGGGKRTRPFGGDGWMGRWMDGWTDG